MNSSSTGKDTQMNIQRSLQVPIIAWLMSLCACRMLTVEEKERLQKEEKLHKADKNIAMALEELNNYR